MSDGGSLIKEVLHASGPASGLEAEMGMFGRLIGSWDLEVAWLEAGKLRKRASGEWHFGYVLAGRAVQDVWIVPSRADRATGAQPYEYGTSLRFYDHRIRAWRSTWMGPVRGVVLKFIARPAGEEIVLEGEDPEGNDLRWVFYDIRFQSFSWRNEVARRGAPFEVTQVFSASRSVPAEAAKEWK